MLYHLRNPCSDDTDEIFFTNDSIKFIVNGTSYGKGQIFVSKKSLTWMNGEHVGVKLSYPKIACHALATQKEESLMSYVLMTYTSPILKQSTVDDEDEEEDVNNEDGNDVSALDMTIQSIEFHSMMDSSADYAKKMFDSISDCMKMSETTEGEDVKDVFPTAGDFGGFYTEGTEQLTSKGKEVFHRLNAMLQDDDDGDDYYDNYEDPQSFGEMAIGGDGYDVTATLTTPQPGQFDDDE